MTTSFDFEKYREYLRLLAAQQIIPQVRGKLDASDVVQESLLQAQQKRDQFRGETEAEWFCWLRTILRNQLALTLRQYAQKCRDVNLEVSIAENLSQSSLKIEAWLAAPESLPSVKAERNEQLVLLADALVSLPVDQREAVELHHLHGMMLADVARVMKRTKPAVAGLIFRGVRALRFQLAGLKSGADDE